MSLTRFVGMAEVRARLKPLHPKQPRRLSVPVKVEPRSKHSMLVGTAFDYLLRFELQRRVPTAITAAWVAEYAPRLAGERLDVDEYTSVAMLGDPLAGASPDEYMLSVEVAKRTRSIVEHAKAALASYLKLRSPTSKQVAELAAYAIRLGKLDAAYRTGRLWPGFEEASDEDIQDLIALLEIVPFKQLICGKPLLLNPTFGEASRLVSGADADIIVGNMLVDFKTTKSNEIKFSYFDQLLGYVLLARRHQAEDRAFPKIDRIGLYFCRHGYLLTFDVSTWTANPEFSKVEKWFFEYAGKTFRTTKRVRKRRSR